MIQYYSEEIEETGLLSEEESAHCCRVLRKKAGDEIYVTDGKGHRYLCEVIDPNPKRTQVIIHQKEEIKRERNYNLTLAVAPTKNTDRMEWLVEKAVEIGIDEIAIIRCSRSERKVQRTDRLKKIMISAMKQSLSARLPLLTELMEFKEFIKEQEKGSQKFFGYCSPEFPKKEFVKECKPGCDVVVMIGPEGDFTPEEVRDSIEKGFIPVTFGEKRLRTETAGVFVVSAVNVINQLT